MAASQQNVPQSVKDSDDKDTIEDVVSKSESHRMTDLGLGRGVDATNPSPWKNKSSFQVRQIPHDMANIIGTEEGGAHQYYEEEISSVNSKQIEAGMSVDVPSSPVTLGIDAEYSRSISKTRIAVGEKVVTRTISFRAEFDDLPLNSMDDDILSERLRALRVLEPYCQPPMVGVSPLPMVRTCTAPTSSEITLKTEPLQAVETFELKLCSWILDRIQARQEQDKESPTANDSEISIAPKGTPVKSLKGSDDIEKLADYIRSLSPKSAEMQALAQDCYVFIALLGITHYVCSIQLGAVRFLTFTQAEYNSKIGAKGKLGVEGFAKASLGGGSTSQHHEHALLAKEIGKIETDKTVKRKPGDEAVIEIRIKPIHTLVHLRAINLAMQKALRTYITERADKSEGPFLIACGEGDKRIYWKVNNKTNQVVGIKDVTRASIFYATQIDDKQHPYEFFIEYYGEDENARKKPRGTADPLSKRTSLAPLSKLLDARGSLFGYNSGPLVVSNEVYEENVRLTLQSRVVGSHTPYSVKSWTAGEEYFVHCSRRKFKIDGYLAMKRNEDYNPQAREDTRGSFEYHTAIVPSVSCHDNTSIWMLFRLLPSEYRKCPALVGESDNKSRVYMTTDFERLFGKDFTYEHERQPSLGTHV